MSLVIYSEDLSSATRGSRPGVHKCVQRVQYYWQKEIPCSYLDCHLVLFDPLLYSFRKAGRNSGCAASQLSIANAACGQRGLSWILKR